MLLSLYDELPPILKATVRTTSVTVAVCVCVCTCATFLKIPPEFVSCIALQEERRYYYTFTPVGFSMQVNVKYPKGSTSELVLYKCP